MILLLLLLPLLVLVLWILKAPSASVQIQDRHIFITGGSSGIGLELAKLAAEEGARKVTLVARNLEKLKEAKKVVEGSCQRKGWSTEVNVVTADVVDLESVKKAVDESGPVDVLVCSHGLAIPGLFLESSMEDVKAMVDINFVGTLNVVMAALPGMLADGGKYARSVAIFCSQAAQAGIYGFAAYSGTKAGLVPYAQGLKQEVFQHGVQVSLIYPPDTDTPGLREENKIKPEITKVLSASSAAMEAVDVARKSLNGIKAGKFNVSCNFDGLALGIVCSGMCPQTSVAGAVLEILALPFVRIVSIFTQFNWYRTIERQLNRKKKCV